jgi:hypothetical protein
VTSARENERKREREFMVIWFSYSLHAYRGPLRGCEPVRLTVVPQGVTGGWGTRSFLANENENCVKIKKGFLLIALSGKNNFFGPRADHPFLLKNNLKIRKTMSTLS